MVRRPWLLNNDCEREGAKDFDDLGRPDYFRSRYSSDDECYFRGYDLAERDERERRAEREEEERIEHERARLERERYEEEAEW